MPKRTKQTQVSLSPATIVIGDQVIHLIAETPDALTILIADALRPMWDQYELQDAGYPPTSHIRVIERAEKWEGVTVFRSREILAELPEAVSLLGAEAWEREQNADQAFEKQLKRRHGEVERLEKTLSKAKAEAEAAKELRKDRKRLVDALRELVDAAEADDDEGVSRIISSIAPMVSMYEGAMEAEKRARMKVAHS